MATPWNDSGVAGMVHTAVWLDRTVGLEVLFIGRSAHAKEDCALEFLGCQLAVHITLRGGWVWLYACGLDEPEPEFIFNVWRWSPRLDDDTQIRSGSGTVWNQIAETAPDRTRRTGFR